MILPRHAWRLRTLLVGQFLAAMSMAVLVLVLMMVLWRLPTVKEQTRQEQGRVADLALFALEQGLDNTEGLLQALA